MTAASVQYPDWMLRRYALQGSGNDTFFYIVAAWSLPQMFGGWIANRVLEMLSRISKSINASITRMTLHFFREMKRTVYSGDPSLLVEYISALSALLFSVLLLWTPVIPPVPIIGILVALKQFQKAATEDHNARACMAVYSLVFWVMHIALWLKFFGHVQAVHGMLFPLALSMLIAVFILLRDHSNARTST